MTPLANAQRVTKTPASFFFQSILFRKQFYFFCASLPFTYAMTVNIGFPLKIYELITCCWLLCFFLMLTQNGARFTVEIQHRDLLRASVYFILIYVMTSLLGQLIMMKDAINSPFWAVGRDTPGIASFVKIIYMLLNLFVFFVIIAYLRRFSKAIIRGWFMGAILSCSYMYYTTISLFLGKSPLLLPGMLENKHGGILFGIRVIRGGTFGEGNYFSLYLICVTILAWFFYEETNRKGYIGLAVMSTVATLMTLSTMGIITLGTFYGVYLICNIRRIPNPYIKAVVVPLAIVMCFALLYVFMDTEYAQKHLIAKLFSDEVQDTISLSERKEQSKFAYDLFKTHPLTGVGANNYGYYFDNEFRLAGRVIPNNIYLELLAEGGVATLLAFLYFIYRILRRTFKAKATPTGKIILVMSIIALLQHWLAYPALTLSYLWVYLAFIVVLCEDKNGYTICKALYPDKTGRTSVDIAFDSTRIPVAG